MKFKFDAKNIGSEAVALGAGYLGIATGRAAATLIPKENKTTERLIRGGMVVSGVAVAGSLSGKDTLTQAVKLASLGVALSQADALISDFASETVKVDETSSQTDRIIAGALGLGCPSSSTMGLGNSTVMTFAPRTERIQIQQAGSNASSGHANLY